MKVHLAGFNVDTQILRELQEKAGARQDITPEVISAAYARISRDPRPINEIRAQARQEVEKTRKSNTTIIFKMGHHSVAEHAVFNLDVIGVSRLAMEELEKFRLCSYTEKSQRYITLDKDYVIPREIAGTRFEGLFCDMVRQQSEAYRLLFEKLKDHTFVKHADLAADPKKHNLLEGWAKEDARYITSLATESQTGLTVNARNLELMLRRFASSSIAEVNELGRALYEQIATVAPSIVIFHQANERDRKTYSQIAQVMHNVFKTKQQKEISSPVTLVEYTRDADSIIVAALLHATSDRAFPECLAAARKFSKKEKMSVLKASWKNMQLYDSMLREFEYAHCTFNVVLSSACFGQLKRHRMATLTTQSYNPALGVTIPAAVREIGKEKFFREIITKTNDVYTAIAKEIPLAAPYVLTNAHRRRVLVRVNIRELYHMSRLRLDAHAQWDIQNVTRDMVAAAKKVMPLATLLACGKDRYVTTYKNVFGHAPNVTEIALPGARVIA
ncbi:MAG: FAD-dependent thymidylate synthase [Candidatus Omnitrophota bacterium]